MNEEIFEKICRELPVRPGDINSYSPLALAFVGDAVYELYIRTLLLSRGNAPVHKLHMQSVAFVKPRPSTHHKLHGKTRPCRMGRSKEGRNAKSGTAPKNADVSDTGMPRDLRPSWDTFTSAGFQRLLSAADSGGQVEPAKRREANSRGSRLVSG